MSLSTPKMCVSHELQLQWTQPGHGCEGPSQDTQVERLCNSNVVTPSSKRKVLILKEQCLNFNVLIEIWILNPKVQ